MQKQKNMHPILFSTEMVKAILEGRKTQTRRIKGLEFINESFCNWQYLGVGDDGLHRMKNEYGATNGIKCPYGKVDDVLWVRETWCLSTPYGPEDYYFSYKVHDSPTIKASSKYDYHSPDKWKPSIHMPFEACRIFLRIKSIRLERLQDISAQDAIAEGIENIPGQTLRWRTYYHRNQVIADNPIRSFNSLWISINGEKSLRSNPWVWVIEFERIQKGEL